MFYDPAAELDAFAADAAAAIHEKYPSARLARLLTEGASSEHPSSGLVLRAARVLRARADLQAAADREGFLALHPTPGSSALCLLEEGWSAAEGWGTWSVGETARIRLPIPPDRRRWQVELELEAFGIPGSLARVGVCLDEREPVEVEFTPGTVEQVALAAEPGLGRRILQLTSPNAIAPASFSVSSDVRRLGVGLRAITLRRT